MPPELPPSEEQIIEQRLVECGLDARGFSVAYQDDLQGIEIVIKATAGATSKHFECLKKAAGYEIVRFEDPEMFFAYHRFEFELVRPELLVKNEENLKKEGLWEGLPREEHFRSAAEFARALEEHAGIPAGTALKIMEDTIVFDPPPDQFGPEASYKRYSKLLAVILYVSVKTGKSIGFIGNEKIRD